MHGKRARREAFDRLRQRSGAPRVTGMLGFLLFGIAAIVSGLAALAVARGGALPRSDRPAGVVALALSALWCAAVAALGVDRSLVQGAEILRNLAWIYVLFRLFANDGRDESLRLVRPLVTSLALVEGLQFVLLAFGRIDGDGAIAVSELTALFRLMVAVGALVLLHNLYGGAADSSRRLLAWNCGALTLFWAYELNVFTVAYLSGSSSAELNLLRAPVLAVTATAFAIGFVQGPAGLAFRPSRAVTFSSLSLALVAAYFLAMTGLANSFARVAGDLGRVTQVAFLLLAAALVLLWLPSRTLRDSLRVLALKHLFKHRYDYRTEWLRFTRTIGSATSEGQSLPERAIQSLADITDSAAGLLLVPQGEGELVLAARWRWDEADVPAVAMSRALVAIVEKTGLVLDFDEARSGVAHHDEARHVPIWLLEERRAWAGVPLLHGERLVGVAVLARPQVARRLDWEDFDLLGIAGRQVASYLAESSLQEALEEASRFEEFNRRMAFVMHDIKNLSSQMGLLARNAERHADNPEFRQDMVKTLRNSTDKLDALVARLGRYGTARPERSEPIDLPGLAQALARRFAPARPIEVAVREACTVLGHRESLEQALAHLVQNAIEASAADRPVLIETGRIEGRGEIAIVDRGAGMSAQFINTELFRPFVSSKDGGFGIGACEARELVRAMGGRVEVESREGRGSRFSVTLPLAEAEAPSPRGAGDSNVEEAA